MTANRSGSALRSPADGGAALLREAVELVLSVPAAALSPEQSLARTDAVLMARTRLRAAELAGVRDLDTRELYALDEAGSVRTWLGQRPYAAGGGPRLTLARRIESSPAAWAALASGAVSAQLVEQALGAADRIPATVLDAAAAGETGCLEPVGRPAVAPAVAKETAERVAAVLADGIPMVVGQVPDEAAVRAACAALAATLETPVLERIVAGFLLVARHVAPSRFRPAVRDLVEALLPQPDPGDDDAYAKRAVTLTRLFDGWWHLDGDLAPELGARLDAELDSVLTAQRAKESAQASAGAASDDEDGAAAGAPAQLPAQRVPAAAAQRHDALATLLSGGGARAVPTPVTVVVSAARLLNVPGAPAAQTTDGHPLPDSTVAAALCSAALTALITGARRQPLDVGRTRRDATAVQRRALTATWGSSCAVLGCGQPGTIPHHVLPWHLGGATDLDNLRPVCTACHDDVHLGGRILTLRDGTALGPTGWVRRPPPTPRQARLLP